MTELYRRYITKHFFADLCVPSSGPLCAIDIDWVLETRWLGMPTIAPAGAMALRSLLCHGYRPILATGRSLEDVRARCAAYRLPGGIAEYGAVVYEHASGNVRSLLRAEEERALAALRTVLLEMGDVELDPAHQYSVRAYFIDAQGHRRGLPVETVESALACGGVGDHVEALGAKTQTDFKIARVDKGAAVRALAQVLDGRSIDSSVDPVIALAVGDSLPDLPMLELAALSFAPADASRSLKARIASGQARVQLTRHDSQAGLLEAVSRFLGCRAQRCPTCRPPVPPSAQSALLLTLLGALNGGKWDKARAAMCAARVVQRSTTQ